MCLDVIIENYPMIPSVRRKWEKRPEDIRAALIYGFDDAINRTWIVPEYKFNTMRIKGRMAEIHQFRIGFAIFQVAIIQDSRPIITDFDWTEPPSLSLETSEP